MGIVRDALGIRPVDIGFAAAVAIAVELNVATGDGAGAHPLNALAYAYGGILVLPVLFRRKWPLRVLIACSVLLLIYYIVGVRRNISPAPLLSLPLYDAALAGYLAVAIVIPAVFMTIGLFVVQATTHERLAQLAADFLPSVVVLALAIMLGDAVRSRRALAAQTAAKLRLADEEREAEAARRVAEERLRIARDLHDTVAHSMATIAVQAGSALHRIGGPRSAPAEAGQGARDGLAARRDGLAGRQDGLAGVQDALVAIRDTSKTALADMRLTLGQLRAGETGVPAPPADAGGLDRLQALSDAVTAAGAPVTVTIEGEPVRLPPGVDHAAYRILQESLTNVLRHAGPDASAAVRLSYAPDALTIQVTDDGTGSPGSAGPAETGSPGSAGPAEGSYSGTLGRPGHPGHGLTGMTERAAATGGQLSAGPLAAGGFGVTAWLPVTPAGASR